MWCGAARGGWEWWAASWCENRMGEKMMKSVESVTNFNVIKRWQVSGLEQLLSYTVRA